MATSNYRSGEQYRGAVCAYRACPRRGAPAVGLQARRWLVTSVFGAPVGATGPEEGLELTRPLLFCQWGCLALFAAEAGDMR
jgi:hypothetical protein